jgi:hypothetical protein
VIAAVYGKGKKVPGWFNVLSTATDWGIPPWEVTGEPVTIWARKKWYFRWEYAAEQRGKKAELDG